MDEEKIKGEVFFKHTIYEEKVIYEAKFHYNELDN